MIGVRRVAVAIWLPTLLIVAWWLSTDGSASLYFPPLRDILRAVHELWLFDHFTSDLLPSLRNMLAGFAIAVVAGATAGLLLGSLPRLLDAVSPVLEFARALPSVAILPIAILVLGLGSAMRVFVIASGALWPVLINTTYAVRGIDPTVRDVERAFGLGTSTRLLRVRLPAALPQILAGARVALYLSVALIVVSEMQGAAEGIGTFVLTAQRNWAVTEMWSGMVVLGVVGYLLSIAMRGGERLLLKGYPADRDRRDG
jgi:ABC-type nitrate/sulfonate/bicarbonate transport system permease component